MRDESQLTRQAREDSGLRGLFHFHPEPEMCIDPLAWAARGYNSDSSMIAAAA